ncbi:D-allose ABC transporter [Klebsiella michiganensis]|uniref:D-allose ABC transporter n=1 Tax=Klebsiella michiganensis TaxID=1134687 RepID=A0A7H4PDB3_9ENTR|nr:D-allose ABC transporter [Klebsiella michiganensis]
MKKSIWDNLKKAGGNVEGFVTTDNVAVGAKGAEFIIDKLGAEGGEVAIIEGKAGNASGRSSPQRAPPKPSKKASQIKLVAQPACRLGPHQSAGRRHERAAA